MRSFLSPHFSLSLHGDGKIETNSLLKTDRPKHLREASLAGTGHLLQLQGRASHHITGTKSQLGKPYRVATRSHLDL